MPRFFAEIIDPDHAVITGRDAGHIKGSLRKRVGDTLSIRDGGIGYEARISSIQPQKIFLDIISSRELSERGKAKVHLGMSIIDLKDMDLVFRAVTELGVADIYPVIAERSNVRNISENRLKRWVSIIEEAVKQCERRDTPVIHEPQPLTHCIRTVCANWPVKLVASQDADVSLYYSRGDDAGIFIGPEGGFSPYEMEEMIRSGCTPVNMGRTVMRSVTAAIT
ncbi:MAG: 16S rRNA (uracil(1498)-N(3))-methyltransferase, partial [Deltaproteobacteria bacterium]|nr:16S rRNA (uracil(1498)-N(3))-methyltransferase [Deltaproteobacteria bacterium]